MLKWDCANALLTRAVYGWEWMPMMPPDPFLCDAGRDQHIQYVEFCYNHSLLMHSLVILFRIQPCQNGISYSEDMPLHYKSLIHIWISLIWLQVSLFEDSKTTQSYQSYHRTSCEGGLWNNMTFSLIRILCQCVMSLPLWTELQLSINGCWFDLIRS